MISRVNLVQILIEITNKNAVCNHSLPSSQYPVLDIDSNPEKQEESSKSREQRSNCRDDQLLHDLPGELSGGHLIDKEPGSEEESNGHEKEGEMGEDSRVDGGDISGHGGDISNSHLPGLVVCCRSESSKY